MKVCLLNDSFPPVIDGVANAVVNYADNLHTFKDTEVFVGTPGYPGTDYSSYPYPVVAFPSLDTTSFTGGYRAEYPFAVKEISELVQLSPDIIHVHCPISSCYIARSLRDATGAPIVLTYHTKYDIDIRRTVPTSLLQDESIKALVANISACDEVWTVSHGAGENLKSLGYEGTFKVMPNGVDFEKGRVSEKEIEKTVKDYDLPEDVPVFLFVGRLMNYKGLPLLLDALHMLSETDDFRMVIIGQGTDKESLKKTAVSYGFAIDEKNEDGTVSSIPGTKKGRIIFTGPVSDRNVLRAWNCRADLFVFPSTFDTNGLVVREAAACGLASLLVEASCAAEGIADGHNGYLAKENAESFAAFMQWACSHTDELHQTGMHAMDEIYLSWHDAVAMARKGYEDILERKKKGLLPSKSSLEKQPLYTMTADAALRYNRILELQHPHTEGMLENYIQQFHDQLKSGQEKITELGEQLRQRLK